MTFSTLAVKFEDADPTCIRVTTDMLAASCKLFAEMLSGDDTATDPFPVTDFSADDVLLWLQALRSAQEREAFDIPAAAHYTNEVVLRLLPLADYFGAMKLIDEIVAWVQEHPTIKTVAAVDCLAGGSMHHDRSNSA